jgi:hypothetical protein
MDYEGLIERNVNNMMDKMFGDKDPALKAITKMNILYDFTDESKNEIENALSKIKRMNFCEAKCIEEELSLTFDKDGNIVFVDSIDETKNSFCEESKSQQNTDICPSDK